MNLIAGNIFWMEGKSGFHTVVVAQYKNGMTRIVPVLSCNVKNSIPYVFNGVQSYISLNPEFVNQNDLHKYEGDIEKDVLNQIIDGIKNK